MNNRMKILHSFIVAASLIFAVKSSGFLPLPSTPVDFHLTAESPEFWNLVEHNAKLSVVASGFGFTEGPVWDPAGFLFVSDETINKIFRVYPDGRKESLVDLGDPDGNTFDAQGRLIDCASFLRAIIRVSPDSKYTILANRF